MKKFLVSFFVISFISLFSREYEPDATAYAIIQYQPESIQNYVNGKLYLKPKKTIANSEGLFLLLDSMAIPLEMTEVDENGQYILMSDSFAPIYYCSNCNISWEYWRGKRCPLCHREGELTLNQ